MRFSDRQQTLFLDAAQADDVPWLDQVAAGARHGWRAVGPAAFVDRLELLLGVSTPSETTLGRLAPWQRAVQALDDGTRSYSASRQADPWGVARYLLARRDAAREAGWGDQRLGGTPLLDDLQRLEDRAPPSPSLAERSYRLAPRLSARPPNVRVELATPDPLLPPWLARLVASLEDAGVPVVRARPAAPAGDSDLARLQRALASGEPFAPQGDGSVVLLREATPWLAGAHLLAKEPARGSWVVSAEAPLLDELRHRHGLPRMGLGVEQVTGWRTAVWLRLLLELDPHDVQLAYALVTLPGGPLSRFRTSLSEALRRVPAVGTEPWNDAVETLASREGRRAFDAAEPLDDATAQALEAADRTRRFIDAWIPAPGPSLGVLECLEQIRAYAQDAELQSVIDEVVQLAADTPSIDRHVVGEWFRLLPEPTRRIPAEAGHPAWARNPAAVLPSDHVIWWGFTSSGARGAQPLWNAPERDALADLGIFLPSAAAERARERLGWLQPILSARSSVTLVSWTTEAGSSAAPHPLTDELEALLGEKGIAACTTDSRSLQTEPLPLRQAAPPRGLWQVAAPDLGPPRFLSPTSIEAMLGCPLRWSLRYLADLRGGGAEGPMSGARLAGSLAHVVLQQLLLGPRAIDVRHSDDDNVREVAQALFDDNVAQLAPSLGASGMGRERERLRTQTVRTAVELVRHLQAGGWWPLSVEEEVIGRFAGHDVRGFADLVVTQGPGRLAVIDIKLGRFAARRQELEEHRSVQLAVYASALRTGREYWPPAGYLVVNEGRLVATSGFPDAVEVPASLPKTYRDAQTTFRFWMDEVAAGRIHARKEELHTPPDDVPDLPLAQTAPPCGYCDFQALCAAREDG